MRNCLLIVGLVAFAAAQVSAADWIAAPSRFTHDPATGCRTHQFAQIPPVYHTPDPGRSAYRHSRSSLQIGDSIDQYHVVEEYGRPVRPYGEWRFPFRPFSVPYHLWGPPYGGFGFGGFPFGFNNGNGFGPFGPGGVVNGAGFPPPWNDGSYPDVRRVQTPPQAFPQQNFNIDTDVTGNDNNVNINRP